MCNIVLYTAVEWRKRARAQPFTIFTVITRFLWFAVSYPISFSIILPFYLSLSLSFDSFFQSLNIFISLLLSVLKNIRNSWFNQRHALLLSTPCWKHMFWYSLAKGFAHQHTNTRKGQNCNNRKRIMLIKGLKGQSSYNNHNNNSNNNGACVYPIADRSTACTMQYINVNFTPSDKYFSPSVCTHITLPSHNDPHIPRQLPCWNFRCFISLRWLIPLVRKSYTRTIYITDILYSNICIRTSELKYMFDIPASSRPHHQFTKTIIARVD